MAIPGGVGQGRKHASARNGGLAPALSATTMYTHYTAARHVHMPCTHMLCLARTYELERYMATLLAHRPSGV